MTDKSAFSEDEWKVLSEAPLYVTLAMVAAGEHGPISMVKEAAASARALTQPGDHGPANEIIAAISRDAQSHEARHDTKEHRGKTLDAEVDEAVGQLGAVPAALTKLPAAEADAVRAWLVDIARAVGAAAKGTSDREQATITRIAEAVGAPAPGA
jgi:hypothetical protein